MHIKGRGCRGPLGGAMHLIEIDAIQKHGQGRRIQFDIGFALARMAKIALLQALVPEHEPTAIVGQDFRPVTSLGYKYEKITAKRVLSRLQNQALQTVMTFSHIRRLREE